MANRLPFTIAPNQDLYQTLNFKPRWAIVDNLGSSWVYFPQALQGQGAWVPPGFLGKVVDVGGLDGPVEFRTDLLPPNTGALTPIVNVPAIVTFTDENVAPSGGTAYNVQIVNNPTMNISANQTVNVQNTNGGTLTIAGTINIGNTPAVTVSNTPNVNIGATGSVVINSGTVNVQNVPSTTLAISGVSKPLLQVSTGAAGASQTTNVPIDAGAQAISIVDIGFGGAVFTHVKVVGHVTGLVYYETYAPSWLADQPTAPFPVLGGFDSSVDVTIAGTGLASFWLVELLQSVPEWQDWYQPPWIAPNQPPLESDGGLAIGGTATILPATANVQYFLHTVKIIGSILAAPTNIPLVNLRTTAGIFTGFGSLTAAGGFESQMDFHGVGLGVGSALTIANASGVALTYRVSLTYSKF